MVFTQGHNQLNYITQESNNNNYKTKEGAFLTKYFNDKFEIFKAIFSPQDIQLSLPL